MRRASSRPEPTIEIGRVHRSFGLQGEIVIHPASDRIQRFNHLKSLTIVQQGEPVSTLTVETIKIRNRTVVVKLDGIESREAANALVNASICIPESESVRTSDWEFFHHDLIGMRVVDISGTRIGTIMDILTTGANDVYVIEDTHGNESLIPAIRDVVKLVDPGQREMVIDPWDGMITKSSDPGK